MKEIEFRNFKGKIYIEDYSEDNDGITIYDSLGLYLNELCIKDKQVYDDYINYLTSLTNPFEVYEEYVYTLNYVYYNDTNLENLVMEYVNDLRESNIIVDDFLVDETGDMLHDLSDYNELDYCTKYEINKIGDYYFKGVNV